MIRLGLTNPYTSLNMQKSVRFGESSNNTAGKDAPSSDSSFSDFDNMPGGPRPINTQRKDQNQGDIMGSPFNDFDDPHGPRAIPCPTVNWSNVPGTITTQELNKRDGGNGGGTD